MKRAKIVKLKLDELAGVDAGAQAAQGSVILKRKIEAPVEAALVEGQPLDRAPTEIKKKSLLTSSVSGHSHLICGADDVQAGTTSGESLYEANASSYSSWHSHPWVRNDAGDIVIGEAAGHTHDIAQASASLIKSAAASKSTRSIEPDKVNIMTTKIVVLSEAQGAHYSTLTGTDAEAFVAKSALERDADVLKAREADPVVFNGEVTKMQVRKSHGAFALQLAQASEENAVAAKRANEMAQAEKTARELAETTKRANDLLGNLAGTDAVHVDVMRAIDSIADVAKRDAAILTLKAANAAMATAGKAKGAGGGLDPVPGTDPVGEWNAAVTAFAEKRGIKDLGKAEDTFLGTEEGLVAKRAYDKSAAAMRRAHGE